MKVYIWQEVLCDYSEGMIVAIADSLEDAINKAREKEGDFAASEMGRVMPTVIEVDKLEQAAIFVVWGGG